MLHKNVTQPREAGIPLALVEASAMSAGFWRKPARVMWWLSLEKRHFD